MGAVAGPLKAGDLQPSGPAAPPYPDPRPTSPDTSRAIFTA